MTWCAQTRPDQFSRQGLCLLQFLGLGWPVHVSPPASRSLGFGRTGPWATAVMPECVGHCSEGQGQSCIALHAGETKGTLNGLLSEPSGSLSVQVTTMCYVIALIWFFKMSQHGESSSVSQGSCHKWKLREEVSIVRVIARTNLPTPACHPSTCCLLNHCGKKWSKSRASE